jgi:hypothetical protein
MTRGKASDQDPAVLDGFIPFVFQRGAHSKPLYRSVQIQHSGKIILSPDVGTLLTKNGTSLRIKALYKPDEKKIALMPTEGNEGNTLKVTHVLGRYSFRGIPLLTAIGVTVPESPITIGVEVTDNIVIVSLEELPPLPR